MVVVRDATPSRLSAVEMGDIITYRRRSTPGLLVTHRVVRVIDTSFGPTFLTRGDANDDVDTVPTRSSDVVGIYSGRIPRGGSLALAVAGVPFGLLVLALVLALVVLGTGKGRMRITRGNRPKDPINRQRKEMGK